MNTFGAGRRSRFGIPPVNQNPLPPNATQPQIQHANQAGNGGAAGPGGPRGSGHGPHNGNNNRGNQGRNQGGRNDYRQDKGGHGNNGGGGGGGGGGQGGNPNPYTPGQGQPDPRDATYYANVARLQFQEQQGLAQLQLQQTYANTNFNQAQEQMALNRQMDQESLAAKLFHGGLTSSGYGSRQAINLAENYGLQSGSLLSQKSQGDAQRLAQQNALQQGLPLDIASELAAATDRFTQAQIAQATSGEGIATKADLKAIQKLLKKGKKGKGGGGNGRGNNNGGNGRGGNH